MSYIEVNDIFDDLSNENKRLLTDLKFADKCLKMLIDFKEFIELISHKFKYDLDLIELQNYVEMTSNIDKLLKNKPNVEEVEEVVFKTEPDSSEEDDRDMNDVEGDEELNGQFEDPDWDQSEDVIDKPIARNPIVIEPIDSRAQTLRKVLPFPCNVDSCKMSYNSKVALKRHQKKHGKKRPPKPKYPCPFGCAKSFISECNVNNHIKNCHSDQTMRCDIAGCPYKTSLEPNMRAHRLTHSTERNFPCPEYGCEKSFKARKDMEKHYKRVHQMIIINSRFAPLKRFVCRWNRCRFSSSNPVTLAHHTSLHSEDKPWVCTWEGCTMTFMRRESRNDHMLSHYSSQVPPEDPDHAKFS